MYRLIQRVVSVSAGSFMSGFVLRAIRVLIGIGM